MVKLAVILLLPLKTRWQFDLSSNRAIVTGEQEEPRERFKNESIAS